MTARQPRFNQEVLIDTTPLPDDIPKVKEVGASSAPLMSASFFIGARCKSYNDDYMMCKHEANGRGELDCMREGRKVTRCAASVLEDINKHCIEQFRGHWKCLERNNQQMWNCRGPEIQLNKCVFDNIGLEKVIPGTPKDTIPIHLRDKQVFANPWRAYPVKRGQMPTLEEARTRAQEQAQPQQS
ncbi:NADH-ubiquinone oxidoreductase-like protein 20.8 kDa subunit [Rhizodiscina lignyota]|uniref:NADH-ubiquinone oxidoreductase n=1 Tax=Rhizodiscina lignyota TaxID=1504668 RepID=A0A9P4IFT6_9PEZI|nr:NADH-ubiquinone oxidoreductase-like protein 20.8 kDa subunit [Rhizodiscina lignyota]